MTTIDDKIKEILNKTKTMAVVGASRDPNKAAHRVPKHMQRLGYKIIPVNPFASTILGEKSYKSLREIPEPVDLVNVFRPSEEALEVVKEAILIKPKYIWLQLGIENEEAKQIAEEAGIEIIMNRCLSIECNRLGL